MRPNLLKPILILATLTLSLFPVLGQSPEMMSFQAVIRNSSDALVTNQKVGMQISILQGSASGTAVYVETQTPTTNANGLVSIEIGGGAGFDAIDWANGPYFIKTETDPAGGTSYSITGTSQLLSVPYALHSKMAETVTGEIAETDPVFTAWDKTTGISVTESQITDLGNYVETETDPEFTAWDKSTGISITESQISDLGNYVDTETDPAVAANFDFTDATSGDLLQFNGTKWVKVTPDYISDYTVTESDVTAHQAALAVTESQIIDLGNYLETETDPEFTAWDKSTGISITENQISDLGNYVDTETDPAVAANFDFTGAASGDLLQFNGTKWVKVTPDYISDYTVTESDVTAHQGALAVTESQISDLNHFTTADETDPSVPTGNQPGEMQYWNGTTWVTVAATLNEGATLQMIGGVPTWIGGTAPPPNVTNPTTGQIWMNRNLGASQVATSSTDAAAYGDLYQWGRGTDGHEKRTSGTTSTLSATDTPGHGDFITNGSSPYDWRSPQNDNLWQGVSGTNNPCPAGYRLPTAAEWEAERTSWSSNNAAGAFASPLKLPVAGGRYNSNGSLGNVGSVGFYWSSTVDGADLRSLFFSSSNANVVSNNRADGFSVRCIKDEGATSSIPTVTTTEATEIAATTATTGGEVTADGGESVTARGVVYSTTETPTIAINEGITTDGTDVGSFISFLTGLTAETTYYVRAYATNAVGTAYGAVLSFTTASDDGPGDGVTDTEGNHYTTVIIGTQEWMVENLKTTKYNDGTNIPLVTGNTAWINLTTGAYAIYPHTDIDGLNSDVEVLETYGALYNWYAVETGNLCPTGWHVPTDAEWTQLTDFLGGANIAGGKLKETGTTHWLSPNAGATNETGFSALPGGNRFYNGPFSNVGDFGYWWSSTESDATNAWIRYMSYGSGNVDRSDNNNKRIGFSVRCIKDEGATSSIPTVTTTEATEITATTATTGGEVTADGGESVTARGVVYSTTETPTIAINEGITTDGTDVGSFISSLTGLTAETTYYVRAYATNAVGTAYGAVLSFTTASDDGSGDGVTDTEGNHYTTVIIGTQEWMVENLKTTKYNDGTDIPTGYTDAQWTELTTDAYAIYPHTDIDGLNSDVEVLETYGALYNWYAVETGKLCPTGWHVPTDDEWTILTNYLGGESVAGGKLKEVGTAHWKSPNEGATNETGFSALPGGYRLYGNGYYNSVGYYGYWWSSTEGDATNAWFRHMTSAYEYVYRYYYNKRYGYSVRCLKDEGATSSIPTVTTTEATEIAATTATTGGEVTADGGESVTARGVVYSTTETPTIAINEGITTDGTDVGSFISSLTGLTAETTYYVRAYATNSAGTGYGSQVSFTTIASGGGTTEVEVTNPTTGQIWMDRNLGASQVATSSTDAAAYGDLYQWGRAADGHEKRTSGTTSTLSTTDTPGHGNFILAPSSPYDWRSPQNDNLWQGVSGTNNPCPAGYRLPTAAEWEAERTSWGSDNAAGAFGSPLKLPEAGGRNRSNGSLYNVGSCGIYWSSTVVGTYSRYLYFDSGNANMVNSLRAFGFPVRCLKDEGATSSIPTVTTTEATEIAATTATTGGEVTADGGESVTARGVVYSTTETPTIAINEGITTDGTDVGSFISSLTGLTAETTYYVRAYATNAVGTAYGAVLSFTTASDDGSGDGVTDTEGNHYTTVIIGTQEWMVENLKTTKYNDGTDIPTGYTDAQWTELTTDAYAIYPHTDIDGLNSDVEVLETYGALYNWYAVETGKLCPTGWHVPTDAEWTQLTDFLGGANIAGGKLKETGTTHWLSPNAGATNETGFSALPGGGRNHNNGNFYSVGSIGNWWSSTEYAASHAWNRRMYYDGGDVNRDYNFKRFGFSVRCARD